MQEPLADAHYIQRWISVGDVIVLVSSLLAVGVMWGSLGKDVNTLRADVTELKLREITPGARAEIASIRSTDLALQRQLDELRDELRASRREMVDAMSRIEAKLDNHDGKR